MPTDKVHYYFDACVYIAHLVGETTHDEDDLVGLAEGFRQVSSMRAFLMASVILIPEVSKQDPDRIGRMFDGRIGQQIDVDRRVAQFARELCKRHEIKPMDSIHLATAVLQHADYFVTLDQVLLSHLPPALSFTRLCLPRVLKPRSLQPELTGL